jgi:hypothetical protein
MPPPRLPCLSSHSDELRLHDERNLVIAIHFTLEECLGHDCGVLCMCAAMHVLHGYFGTYMISLPVSEVKGLAAPRKWSQGPKRTFAPM